MTLYSKNPFGGNIHHNEGDVDWQHGVREQSREDLVVDALLGNKQAQPVSFISVWVEKTTTFFILAKCPSKFENSENYKFKNIKLAN